MSTESTLTDRIEAAADTVGSSWPLHSFVTANPLSGFEDRPFHEAVAEAADRFDARGYPSASVFRHAWTTGRIDRGVLAEELAAHGYADEPDRLLSEMEQTADANEADSADARVDALLCKYLAAFLDEGRAEWALPNREAGFYAAFRAAARHDGRIPDRDVVADLPADPEAAVRELVGDRDDLDRLFERQFAALPGWTGLVNHRAGDGGPWQSAYPITLAGYLAARLALAECVGAPLAVSDDAAGADDDGVPLPEVWLTAWERTYREELVDAVAERGPAAEASDGGRPDAQFVFCIDTRSAAIRHAVEAVGDYDTHGYAGFFGVPIRYEGYDAAVSTDACPPILNAEHHVGERARDGDVREAHDRRRGLLAGGVDVLKSVKTNAATAFSFVENTGVEYGVALAARTLVPGRVYDAVDAVAERVPAVHEFSEPDLDAEGDVEGLPAGMTHEQRVTYAANAFELMGWDTFARVVVFAGHASQTANNSYDASLDCGACAGNPGGPNARVLAAICNDEDVRADLRERGIDVPEDTVFLAGEHNTTTSEVELYDGDVPESHREEVAAIEADLAEARARTAARRMDRDDHEAAVRETERRAADWAETRPEWGLAGNAGFVVGPPALTADLDLNERVFLHSYDHSGDPDGDALEAILTGPMVVTQWINTQYYFATVDNAVHGSGSKVTQNPVGNVGVYQGNGGDLMSGLPMQSLFAATEEPYHQPLRLTTVVHAPVDVVEGVLADHPELRELLDNGWLSLAVVDPARDHAAVEYAGDLAWEPMSEATPASAVGAEATAEATPPVADD